MANFTVLQNGKVKMLRGRFGGENKRPTDEDFGKSRRQILSDIADLETRQDICLGRMPRMLNSGVTSVASFEPLCPITGQVIPTDGIVHLDADSDVSLSLTYKDGRIQSAHVRTDRHSYRFR